MFSDYSFADLASIVVMQGFAGLSLFAVFVLMSLGLAIIFGQMGVINMAHGEFMILGAYVTWLTGKFSAATCLHCLASIFVAIVLAFLCTAALGSLVEKVLIRHLYKRPLDTLLATWGLSLIMQQCYRSAFGPREVGVDLPEWLMGSYRFADNIDIPINGVFVLLLTAVITALVGWLMYRSALGLKVRAVVLNRPMASAVGINTARIDNRTFALGCGIAGIAGSAFTMIGSTGPTAGQQYIVDTFLVVVFGGAQSLIGTLASALRFPSRSPRWSSS